MLKDLGFIHDTIERIYQEGFARQAEQAQEVTSEMDEAALHQRLKKEMLLITGETFLRGVASLQRINIGAQPLGTAQKLWTPKAES